MKRVERLVIGLIIIFLIAGSLYATSATWKYWVKPGLTIGDIPYADRTDRLTNLNLGSTNQKLVVGTSAPAWQNDSLSGAVTITMTGTTLGTLTAAQYRCRVIRVSGVTGAASYIIAPDTAGYSFLLHNSGTGSNLTIGKTAAAGVTIANNKCAVVAHTGTNYVRFSADATP